MLDTRIDRLRAAAARLEQPCPFHPGDLVVLRGVAGAGPHTVFERLTLPATVMPYGVDVGSEVRARLYDMTIASADVEFEGVFLAWSGDFELYRGDGADA